MVLRRFTREEKGDPRQKSMDKPISGLGTLTTTNMLTFFKQGKFLLENNANKRFGKQQLGCFWRKPFNEFSWVVAADLNFDGS